ncbi:MAG: hypothetical protein ACYTEQ_22705 [Planctomycetota bacterium]
MRVITNDTEHKVVVCQQNWQNVTDRLAQVIGQADDLVAMLSLVARDSAIEREPAIAASRLKQSVDGLRDELSRTFEGWRLLEYDLDSLRSEVRTPPTSDGDE